MIAILMLALLLVFVGAAGGRRSVAETTLCLGFGLLVGVFAESALQVLA